MRIGALLCLCACSYAPQAGIADDAPAPEDTPPPDTVAFVCPDDYVALPGAPGGSVYRISGEDGSSSSGSGRSSWVDAEADCRDDGARTHLAIAETETEYKALSDAVSGATRWLGVSDRKTEGTWIPIIGGLESDYVGHWFNNDPDGGCCDATSDCMTLSGVLQASPLGAISIAEPMPCADDNPDNRKGFICECDGREVDPATF